MEHDLVAYFSTMAFLVYAQGVSLAIKASAKQWDKYHVNPQRRAPSYTWPDLLPTWSISTAATSPHGAAISNKGHGLHPHQHITQRRREPPMQRWNQGGWYRYHANTNCQRANHRNKHRYLIPAPLQLWLQVQGIGRRLPRWWFWRGFVYGRQSEPYRDNSKSGSTNMITRSGKGFQSRRRRRPWRHGFLCRQRLYRMHQRDALPARCTTSQHGTRSRCSVSPSVKAEP